MLQLNAQRVGIEGHDADLGEVCKTAGVVGLRVSHRVHEFEAAGREVRREHAPARGDEILRGHGLAVGPAGIGAEVESVGEAVGGDLPRLGDARHGMQVDGIFGDESFKKCRSDVDPGQAGDEVRIEIGEVDAEAAVEHLVADAAFDRSPAWFAAGGMATRNTKKHKNMTDTVFVHFVFLVATLSGSARRRGRRWRRRGRCRRRLRWSWP